MINKNFTFLWIGQIISQLGDKFYAIALAWWILQRTNSPSIMGLFLLVSVLPGVLCGFFTGALTDRWKRKTMLVVTDIIRGALVLVISYLSLVHVIEVWHIFLIGFCLSIATSFFSPAIQSIIPEIVEKEKLNKANSMSQMISGVCTVVGPMLGAFAVSVFGLTWVFLANSISYFISSFLACFIITNKTYYSRHEKKDILKEIFEGIRFIKKQKNIVLVLTVIAIAHFFVGSLTVSLPFLSNGLIGNGVNNLGYLQMAEGAGLLAGSLYIGLKKKVSLNQKNLILFIMGMGLCYMVISVTRFLGIQTVYIYLPVMMVIGVLVTSASVFWQSLLQRYTPSHMTGRVFSISTLTGNTTLPIAYGIFGVLLNLSSVPILMAACGLSLVILCLFLYFSSRKNQKELGTTEV